MGLYLPNMEMPKGGYRTVEIGFDADGHPMTLADGGDVFDVIPIPPHGRLGDLDNLALLVLNWISTQEKAYPHEDSNALAWRLGAKAMANQIYRDIKAYPTIIPTEEASDEYLPVLP